MICRCSKVFFGRNFTRAASIANTALLGRIYARAREGGKFKIKPAGVMLRSDELWPFFLCG